MTKYIKCGGGGLPPQVLSDMEAVLNKKFGTSTTYPSNTWPDLIRTMIPLPEKSASGSIAHFTDGADTVPLKSSKFYITPKQAAGTPTPSTPLPITGWSDFDVTATGANLCGGNALLSNCQNYLPTGTTDTVNKTFKFTSGTATDNDYSFTSGIKFKTNTTYTVILSVEKSNSNSALNMRIRYTDGTNLDFSMPAGYEIDTKYTVVFTSNASKTILDVRKSSVSGGTTLYYEECGVFEGTLTATDFAPYTATTYPVTLGQIVYGGFVKDGEVWASCIAVKIKDLSWTYQSANTRFYTNSIAGDSKHPSSNSETLENFKCEVYKYLRFADFSNNLEISMATSGNLFLRDTSYTDVDTWLAAVGNNYICYELATPVKLADIDPLEIVSRLGVNNIWCECGDSEVEYRADIELSLNE